MDFLGEGILTQDENPWKHSRELLRRQFARVQYQNSERFSEHVDNLVANLSLHSGDVDLQPFFFRFTLDTTTALMFGESIESLKVGGDVAFEESFTEASLINSMRVQLSDFYWAYTPSRYTKACSIVKNFADDYVEQTLRESKDVGEHDTPSRYAFIRELYEELKDPALVRDQIVNVLIAGRDSTACLMFWTMEVLFGCLSCSILYHPGFIDTLNECGRNTIWMEMVQPEQIPWYLRWPSGYKATLILQHLAFDVRLDVMTGYCDSIA